MPEAKTSLQLSLNQPDGRLDGSSNAFVAPASGLDTGNSAISLNVPNATNLFAGFSGSSSAWTLTPGSFGTQSTGSLSTATHDNPFASVTSNSSTNADPNDPVLSNLDRASIDTSVDITDTDAGHSTADVNNDSLHPSGTLWSTLHGTIDLNIAYTSSTPTATQQSASADVTGWADGDTADEVNFSSHLSGQRGGSGQVQLSGDSSQNQTSLVSSKIAASGSMNLSLPAQNDVTGSNSLDLKAGSATHDANTKASSSLNAGLPHSSYIAASSSGSSSLDDSLSSTDTNSSANTSANIAYNSPGSVDSTAQVDDSAVNDSVTSQTEVNAADGGYGYATTSGREVNGYVAESHSESTTPSSTALVNSSGTSSAASHAAFGDGTASSAVTAAAATAGDTYSYSNGNITYFDYVTVNGSGQVTESISNFDLHVAGAAYAGYYPGGTAYAAVQIGIDQNGDGYSDATIFNGSVTVQTGSSGATLSTSGWSSSDFSFNPSTGDANLNSFTYSASGITPAVGSRTVVSVQYFSRGSGDTVQGSASMNFAS